MTVEGLVSCTCIMENTAVFIMRRREIGERNGIKEQHCMEEEATRSTVQNVPRRMDAGAVWMERRNEFI